MSEAWLFVLGTFGAYFVCWVIVESVIAQPYVDPMRKWLERRWIRKHAATNSEQLAYESSETWNSKAAYLLSCIPCLGFWVSGAYTMLLSKVYGLGYPVVAWLAMAGIIGLIARFDRN